MAKNSLPSPLESALANAPTFGLPESFKQAAPQQQASFTPGEVPFQPYFNAASSKYGVPVNVLMALAQQESSFNPTALGQPTKYGRAKGLMQYIDSTAAGMGINPYDPVQSIDAAAKQLKTRLDQGYTMQEAISAHFGGDDRKQWGPKTRAYGMEVLDKAQRFLDGTPASRPAQSSQQGAQPVPGALPTATSPDLTALQERGSQIESVLSQLNQDEPDRYRPLTQEEIAKYQQQPQQAEQPAQQPAQQSTQELPALDYSKANEAQAQAKGAAEEAQQAGIPRAELRAWEPTLWDRVMDLIPGNRDAAAVELAARRIAARDGVSVDEVYRSAGGIRPIWNPEVRAPIRALAEGAEVVGKQIPNVPKAAANATLRAIRGGDVPAEDKTMIDRGITATEIPQDKNADPNYASLAGLDQSLGFTVSNLVPSLAVGAAGNLVSPGVGTGAGFATSGSIAYRSAKDQFLSDVRKLAIDKNEGKPLTEKQWDDIRIASEAAATKYGAWEAIPEALGTVLSMRLISSPLKGGTRAAKLADALGRMGKAQAMEQGTETATTYGQNKQEQAVGLTKEDLTIGDAFRQQALQTALVSGISSGTMQGGRAALDFIQSRRAKTQEEPQAEAGAQPEQAQQNEQPAAQQDQPQEGVVVPTQSRDDTGLSADAGPLERAVRGTAQQPDAANGNFWAGEPGATIQMQAKGEPETAMVATVERYERDGGVTVRGEDGSPYTVSQEEVDITAVAEQPQAVDQQMQDAGTTEEVKAERAQVDEQQAQERQTAIEQALQEQGVDPNTGEILDSSPAVKEEAAPVQKALEDMEEGELRDRMRYLARQAKTNGGWDKRLTDERRKVERVLDAKVRATAKSEAQAEQPAARNDEFAPLFDEQGRRRAPSSQAVKDFKEQHGLNNDAVQAIHAALMSDKPITLAEARAIGEQVAADRAKRTAAALSPEGMAESSRQESEAATKRQQERESYVAEHGAVQPGHYEDAETGLKYEVTQGGIVMMESGDGMKPYGRVNAGAVDENGVAFVSQLKGKTVRPTAQSSSTPEVLGKDGQPKWFGSQPKAEEFITKKGLTDTHELKQVGTKWEIHPKAEQVAPTATVTDKGTKPSKTPVNPRTNRVKKLVGEVGQTVSPSGEVGGLQPGARYTVDRIEKNGTTYLTNQETGETATVSMPDLEVGKSRRVEWSKVEQSSAAQPVVEAATVEPQAQQPASAESWREQATAALELVPDDHPMKRKWAANVKNGLKSESDRAGVMQSIVAAQSEPASNPDDLSGDHRVKGAVGEPKGAPLAEVKKYLDTTTMPLDRVIERGDEYNSPWLMSDGAIVGTGGDHIDLSSTFGYDGYRDMSLGTNAIRAGFHKNSGGTKEKGDPDSFVSLQIFDDQKLTPEQYATVKSFVEATGAEILLGVDKSGNNLNNTDMDPVSLEELAKYASDLPAQSVSGETVTAPVQAEASNENFAGNKIFTADKVEAARARMRSKFGQLNSGIDPEMLVDGMTIAGAYIESGVRKFSDYAKAMVGDFGDGVKPYLLSFWEGARNYPGLDTEGMTSVADSATEHAAMLKPADLQSDAVGEVKAKPAKRTRKTGQKGDITLTQDWGVDHVDGFGENTSGRETGSDLKDGFLKEARQYLNAVADALEDAGFTLPNNAKGKPVSSVNVNAGGDAVSGDVTLNMNGPAGVGIYINISGTSLRGAVPTTTSGISVMYRTTTPEDRLGTRSQNQWAPVDLSAKDLADMVMASVQKVVARKQQSATQAQRPAATDENGPRPTSGLDAMVAEFDAEVERNGTATELGEPGAPALERAPSEPVRAAAEVRETGSSPAAGSAADGRGDGRPGAAGDDRARGLGDDAGELPVPARGAERAGRSRAERSSTASRDGDAAGRAVLPAAGVTSQDRPADLFTINAEEIGQGGDKTKFANNVAAIRVLKDLETTGRPVTAADQAALAKYVGWGGIPSAFERTDSTANKGWEKQVAELKALLTPEEYAAAAASTRNAHYTSPEIVTGMWKALARLGFAGGRVIEPSVGVGNFFGLMPQDARGASALHGVELDRITSGIATALYPDAKIARMGYQEYAIPDGYFDVAVGNPPFGSEKLYDANRKDLSGFSIHNYFFARSVDALRPGGVLAMVVTNRFLDGNSDKARQYIAERADLVGAIRLPNSAFAKNAGTEVTTDIIILQRRAPGQKPNGTSWMNVVDYTDKNGATVPLNEYFQANPDNMLGEFGAFGSMYRAGDSALVAREGQNTQRLLDAAISRLPADIMQPAVQVKPETRETVQAENVRVGSMFISGDGRVMVRGEDELGDRTGEAVEFRSAKAEERVKGMLRLRDNLSRLRQLQLSNTASEAAIEEARARLNKTYDSFVKINGPINSQANKLLFRDDPTWPQISALEDSYDRGVSAAVAKTTGEEPRPQSAVKAAIFTKRTQQPYSPPTSAKTAKDALVASLAERGRVDMEMMVQLYGKTEEQIANELGDLLFSDPDAGWQTRDQYLSGNVKRKLARAEEAAKTSQAYARNVEALRAVQPRDIEAVDINVKPGASWIPADVMASFADHITEKTGSKAFFNPLNANWSFPKLEATSSATARFGTSRMSVGQIIEAASAQKAVQVFDEARDGTRTLNEIETQLANDKVKAVKEEWDRWIWSDDARRASLSRFYNDLFNTDVSREYDGSHLTFPGKISDDIIKLRPHQGNAVWRIVQGGSTLADHVVGAGKTFTLVAAAMELRRLGLARKPMFVVPNHLVGQWAQDFIKLYPGANVLAATKRDFEKANRKRFFARIATGDWDAVIVAHSSFGKVGMKPETEAEFIQEEIADLTASIDAIEAAEGKKSRNVKQAAERRTKMQEKLKALLDTGNKDDSLYWDDLGIDALFLDEAHEFKNLAYSTGMRNVAGLGSSAGSQKATDLYMKTRVVRKATGGRNVVFATGTPISNTMAEMYTMQRYLDYDNLKASGLSHFDAWARMFGEVVTDWELSPSGQYKMNSRFSKFVNMPELMQRYTSFADVINRDDINRMLAAQGKRLPVPKVKGGKPQNVVVDRSQWQAQYIGEPIKDADGNDTDQFPEGSLVYRAENLPKKAEKGGDNMLKIMSDARKAALDMRLIDPDYPDNPDSKVNFAANNIKADYDRWHADRGTQLVFIDLSTPKGARADEAAQLRDLIQRAESNDPAVAEPAQAELDKISPDEIDALNSAFSVYDDLKQKLVERGIPADEIAFIHDAKTDLQKTDLFAKVRSGRVRVLFGSTAKMGAGMNVQDRLVALHHLDAPWRPSDLEQREGRIIRQGNKLYDRDPEGFEVGIYRYATKQTLDSRMWQTIEGKANFIEQVRKGNTSTREIEDVAGEAANAAEMKAASSGNPLILEEMSLRQRIRTLENERTAHDRDQFRIRDRIGMEQGNVRTINRQLDELRADDKLAQPAKFEVTIDGQTFDKRKDAGEAIMQQALQMEQTGEETRQIGNYGGFSLTLEKIFAETYALEVSGTGTYSTKVAMGDDPAGLAMRMTNSVRDLPAAIEKMEEALAQSKAAITALQAQVKVWPKEEQLKEATARHAEVIEQLRPKKKTEAAEKPAADEPQLNDLAMDTAYSRLPEGNRIQLAARLRKLEQQKEQLTPEQYSEQLGELAGWLEERSQENAFKRAVAERQRGADMVLERLHRARRRGEIGEDAADIAIWALNRNPQLAEDLGFSISSKGGSRYDRAERVARLMTEAMRDTAPIHEILHHTERMMPPGVQKGIAQEYNKAWARAYKKATPEQREALDALRLSAFGNSAARDATMKAFQSGLLDYDQHYQLTNASEYWAVNAASIMSARHSASKQGWVARAREWMRGFIQKLRAVFGLPSTAAVIRGLDAVTKGDGSFLTTSMLATNPAADTPLRDLSGDYADMPKSPSGMDPAPEIPNEAQDNAMLRSWWDRFKNAPSDLTTDAMQKGLALIPFRPLVQEMARNMPAAAEYLRLKQSMDAMRNRWHAKTDEVAQNWLKYRKDNTDENVELMNLMHEATIAGVDPSEEYQSEVTNRDREALRFAAPGSDREKELLKRIMEDKKQREEWDKLNARYKALSPQARKVFQDVRDAYTSLADEYEKVLLANMEKAINVRIKKAEREHRYEQQRIQDEGLTGDERTEAMDAADKKLRTARTKTAWNRKARMTQLRQQFEMNRLQGPYFPLARFGNLFVTVRDAESGKVLSFSKFEKAAEQREFADLMRQNKDYKVSVGTLDDSGSLRKAVDPNFVADVEDILADLPNAETVKDEVWQRYLESLPDYSVRKNRIHRTGRAGFNADALRAFGNQMFHGSHQLARLAHSFDMEEALDATREEANVSKDPVRDGLVVNEMEKRHEFIMNPTGGPLVQKITQAAFIYALAASPKAALVNLSQTVIMGIPILAGYDGSAKGVTRAVNQLTRALADFTAGKGKAENSKRLTADERKAMQEAYDNGTIDRTQSHDLAGIGETGVEYSPARTKVMGWLAWGFHHTERLNREVTFLAAYRMARAKGLPHVGAAQKAGDLTWRTHFDYQNTSRPRIMHNDTMKALLVFRNFTINMLYRLFRDIHQAASGDTPEVRREAKIQLAGITGMMMLSAGITGTWGFGIMMVLASAFMDDDKDPEAELKKNMVEALGPMMAGIVLDGVPGYATGTSLSDSIGMRDLWFRSPSTQLEGKDEADYWKAQLLGAAPSIADNIVRGYGLLKEGQTYRGIETMMPKAIKDPMKAIRYSAEGATNKRGDVIVEDIDTLDIIRQALGFVPAKIAEQYDINNAGYNLQQTILRKRQQLMDEWWKAEEKEDEAKLESLEKDIEAYNDKYPEQEITPKTLRRSARTREDNAENATGGIRYNRKLRDRILEEQAPTIYR